MRFLFLFSFMICYHTHSFGVLTAFQHLRIRIGGSLQDQVLYDIGPLRSPCHPFRKINDGLFGYSKGCLCMNRWDKLNRLFSRTG